MKIDVKGLKSFIDDDRIWAILKESENASKERVSEILEKAKLKKGLSREEAAILLQNDDPELLEEMYHVARRIKEEIYGNRIVLFAPLYVGNECVNDCVYCGFRISNKDCHRKTLSKEEQKQKH